jgi:hypothetical protein
LKYLKKVLKIIKNIAKEADAKEIKRKIQKY